MLADGILRITRKQLYDEIWQMSVEIREYIAAITATECDDTFVEDDGWHKAYERYEKFTRDNIGGRILFLETGVGANTPRGYKVSVHAHGISKQERRICMRALS